jgi:hypothetical protein
MALVVTAGRFTKLAQVWRSERRRVLIHVLNGLNHDDAHGPALPRHRLLAGFQRLNA